MRESQFFLFFIHPRPRTTVFFDFLLIRDLGQPIFLVFYSSETSDDCLFRFSAYPRPRTANLSYFLSIRGLGRQSFSIFCLSETSEDYLFRFFANPRPRTANLSCFLFIRGLGQPRSNAFDTWHATENEKAVESCPAFNLVEFGAIRIGIIQLFPNTEKLHRITVTEPVGEKAPPPLARSISVRLIWSSGIALLLNVQID